MGAYLLRMHWADKNKLYMLTGLLLFSLSLVAGFLFAGFATSEYQFILLFPGLVIMTVAIDHFDQGVFTSRLKSLGDLTYGIYLWHIPIQMILLLTIGFFKSDRDIVSQKSFFAGFIVLVLAVAHLSYRYFELPMRIWLRNRALSKVS